MTASTPDDGTDLGAILTAAKTLPERRRQRFETLLTARLQAALTISAAAAELVTAWRSLYEQSEALAELLNAEGMNSSLREPEWVIRATEIELHRLGDASGMKSPPQKFPCVCGGVVGRPDLLVPLADLVRDANTRIRAQLA